MCSPSRNSLIQAHEVACLRAPGGDAQHMVSSACAWLSKRSPKSVRYAWHVPCCQGKCARSNRAQPGEHVRPDGIQSSESVACSVAMCLTLAGIGLPLIGCGSSEAIPPRDASPNFAAGGGAGGAAAAAGQPASGGRAAGGSGGQYQAPVPPVAGNRGSDAEDDAGTPSCAAAHARATVVKQPVDIVMILDNSGSMDDELRSVEANINQGFASILQQSGVDYRVILISQHRRRDREDTAVCITGPLSGLTQCPADQPVFSQRFFQYSVEVGSRDSFDILLDSYAPPFDRDAEEEFDKAPMGWSAWLRPGAKKVFVEITDDDENEDVLEFLAALSDLSRDNFGTAPNNLSFVWHSIVGVVEKAQPTEPYLASEPIEQDECDNVKNAGETYQELSRLTGGLRFPICQFQSYGTVFRVIAEDVAKSGDVACDFAVPASPQGQTLNLDTVAVSYKPGNGGAEEVFTQAASATACKAGAFYAVGERIYLCPQTCASVRTDAAAKLDVVFSCENTITLR